MSVFQASRGVRVGNMVTYHVEGNIYQHGSNASEDSLPSILQPITDASHTRDRKRAPPNSACFRGTRIQVVRNVNGWARSGITNDSEPHIRWMHGYVGSGKSSISQEVCDTSEREERPVISFFFFRNAGDRSKIWRLGTTLASQMAAAVPETEPFIRAAVRANPALLAPDEGGISLRARMQGLVYAPFKAAVRRNETVSALRRGPLLIVLDGLDECDTKDEVQELIDGMLEFFDETPFIPLRVFTTSRIEEHIQSRLNVPGVLLDNLVDHCSDDDIATFLDILFEDGCRRNSVVRAYVQQHGKWPTQSDRRRLVEHIGGSFIFGSAVFKFIMGLNGEGNDGTTPINRLPLALKMNPGLDGLYAQTLARSKHLPRFSDIISTIALLEEPLPTSGIAEILGIHIYEVINVLVHLQAIIQVPGTDDIPVTLCHTSLRDFLTTQSRSREFYAHPAHHVRLYLRCLECQLKRLQQDPELFARHRRHYSPVARYVLGSFLHHMYLGDTFFKPSDFDSAIGLCREGLALQPRTPELIQTLAGIVRWRAHENDSESSTDWSETVSLSRAVLELHPFPHPRRSDSLNHLSTVLLDRYMCTHTLADLGEAISVDREALTLHPSSHPYRSRSLNSLADSLLVRFRSTYIRADLEEAILIQREALKLQPFPEPGHTYSLYNLANTLMYRYKATRSIVDLDEAISLQREALQLRPFPHPARFHSLHKLGVALAVRHGVTGVTADLEEAISLHREALDLRPSPQSNHPSSLIHLGVAFVDHHRLTKTMADLEEAIPMLREALTQIPYFYTLRPTALERLIESLQAMYEATHKPSHIQEALEHCEDLLKFNYPLGHRHRVKWLRHFAALLRVHFDATGQAEDLARIAALEEEATRILAEAYTESAT